MLFIEILVFDSFFCNSLFFFKGNWGIWSCYECFFGVVFIGVINVVLFVFVDIKCFINKLCWNVGFLMLLFVCRNKLIFMLGVKIWWV